MIKKEIRLVNRRLSKPALGKRASRESASFPVSLSGCAVSVTWGWSLDLLNLD